MKNKKNISTLAFLLAILMLIPTLLISCNDDPDTDDPSDTVGGTGDTAADVTDEVPALDLDEREFNFLIFEQGFADMTHVFDEPSDDPVDYAKYLTITELENRFNVDIVEYVESDGYVNSTYRSMIQTGADDYDIVFAYDLYAHYFAEEGVAYDYESLGYVDLEKDYWDQCLLEYTTVGDQVYYAFGTYDFTYYDLTHCLVFNKGMISALGCENPYDLVTSGEWTMDKMYEMCRAATVEVNGDGKMTDADNYGFLASGKQILPNFWISSGTTTVKLNSDNLPEVNISGNERLSNVIDKCFEMFWNGEVWSQYTGDANQPDNQATMFKNDQGLFADYTFYYLSQLRDSYVEFGILPYPKYDSEQTEYHSRVEAGSTVAVVPITNADPLSAGAILEAMASTGYSKILPAYYESVLKRKISRDEESQGMLDLIFKTRVYDLGDTWYCDQIRDGLFKKMWNNNQNRLSSMYAAYRKMIDSTIEETIKAYS